MATDPLGLVRCHSCANAFEFDEQPDGTCGHCGGPFRRRGRPARGAAVKVRLPGDVLADVEAFAAREGVTRAEALRRLVVAGLAH
jgi:hypothetical protein